MKTLKFLLLFILLLTIESFSQVEQWINVDNTITTYNLKNRHINKDTSAVANDVFIAGSQPVYFTLPADTLAEGDSIRNIQCQHLYKDVYCVVKDTGAVLADSIAFEEYFDSLNVWVPVRAYDLYADSSIVSAVPGAGNTRIYKILREFPGLIRARRTNVDYIARLTPIKFEGVNP